MLAQMHAETPPKKIDLADPNLGIKPSLLNIL